MPTFGIVRYDDGMSQEEATPAEILLAAQLGVARELDATCGRPAGAGTGGCFATATIRLPNGQEYRITVEEL